MILIGNSINDLNRCKTALHSKFTFKDLGPLKYFLSLKVARSSKATIISQTKFISDVLKNAGVMHCKSTSFLFPQGLHLTPYSRGPTYEPEIYRRLLGRLLYVNLARPNISYTVQHLSQFMNVPRKPHWEAVLYVLRYLKGALHQGLYYSVADTFSLIAYCDSDWASCSYYKKSIFVFCIFLSSSLIFWKIKK